ncbi:hypothetical protein [Algibacter sp. L4_22]|nr:hypothetical protein [Algibacter sp. L4_22]
MGILCKLQHRNYDVVSGLGYAFSEHLRLELGHVNLFFETPNSD